jgi:hypothetical protein
MGGMADLVTSIVEKLKADAGLTALVETRVFGDELPADQAAAMPRRAIRIQPSGGAAFAPASKTRAEAQRFDLIAYGATPMEAATLRQAASKVLLGIERQFVDGVLIHWVQSAGGYLTGRDRDGAWPYAFQSFQTFFEETA